jgi:tetratricopeptide (TPR) repeat protein
MGKTYYVLAVEDFWSSRPRQGVEHGRRAVALLEGTAERYWLAISHWVVGLNLMVLGEFDSALEAEARTRAIGEAIGDSRLQSYAAWTTGRTLATRGEWAAAIEACRQAVDSSRDPFSAAVAAGILGYVYLEKADATEAIPLLERSVEAFALFDARQHRSMFTAYLSEAYLVAGDLDRATEMGLEGLNAGKFGHTYGVGWSRRVLGRIAQRRGDRSQAQRHLEDALECFRSSEAPLEVGRTLLALAEVTLSTETPSAAAHLRKAHELFVTLRVPPHVDRAQLVARQLGVSLT